MTAEARIQQVSEHLIRAITEDPSADYEMLEKVTCGLVTKDAHEGNGLDIAKRYYRSLRNFIGESESETPATFGTPMTKRRGRKPGSKAKRKVATKKTATKTTTAPKKRGRPKGSKNKPPVAKKTSSSTAKKSTKGASKATTTGAAKKRGRPKGSKNKPKNVEETTTE
jgi:hypothetical protein